MQLGAPTAHRCGHHCLLGCCTFLGIERSWDIWVDKVWASVMAGHEQEIAKARQLASKCPQGWEGAEMGNRSGGPLLAGCPLLPKFLSEGAPRAVPASHGGCCVLCSIPGDGTREADSRI